VYEYFSNENLRQIFDELKNILSDHTKVKRMPEFSSNYTKFD